MHKSISVIAGAACRDLTILETAKAELGILESDTSKDDLIAVWIKQASSIVSAYCDDMFAQETLEETFWSDAPSEWARSFMLAREPVSAIISVEIDGLVLDPSEYRLATDNHIHRVDATSGVGICQWSWTSTAVITYTCGYLLLDDLPYGVEKAALMLIKDYHSSVGRDPNVRSEDIPGVRSVTYGGIAGASSSEGYLPSYVTALLAPYKKVVFA